MDVVNQEETAMTRNLLLDTLLGHLALLEQRHPKKAASPVAKRLKRHLTRPRIAR
jgi:hypothetical protein